MGETQNEPALTLEAQPDPGALAKIGGIARHAFEQVQSTIKRGRGRPRRDGVPKISDTIVDLPLAGEPAPVPSPAALPAATIDSIIGSDVIRACCSALVKGLCAIPEGLIRVIGHKKKVPEAQLEAHLAKCSPLEAEIDALAKVLPIIAKKYGFDLENSPEGVALVLGSVIVGRYGVCAITLAKIKIEGEPIGQPANAENSQ